MTLFLALLGLLIALGGTLAFGFLMAGGKLSAWLAIPLGLACLLGGCFLTAYEANQPNPPFTGYVMAKNIIPAHIMPIMAGKVLIMEPIPTEYQLTVRSFDNQKTQLCDVDSATYEAVTLGQDFHCGGE